MDILSTMRFGTDRISAMRDEEGRSRIRLVFSEQTLPSGASLYLTGIPLSLSVINETYSIDVVRVSYEDRGDKLRYLGETLAMHTNGETNVIATVDGGSDAEVASLTAFKGYPMALNNDKCLICNDVTNEVTDYEIGTIAIGEQLVGIAIKDGVRYILVSQG